MNAFLYRAFNSQGELLYVGITLDPKTRLRGHKGEKPWWGEVSRLTMEVFASWDEAAAAETLAIASEYPRYNKAPGNQASPNRERKVHTPRSYQPLPQTELDYLSSLDQEARIIRAYELYRAGWSIKSILQGVQITPSSSWLVNQFGFYTAESTGVPIPDFPDTPTATKVKLRKEEEAARMRPQLNALEKETLRQLAEVAATYRPNHGLTHPTTIAVGQYNKLIRDLKARGVRTEEIAQAAGVNESNIRRRLRE